MYKFNFISIFIKGIFSQTVFFVYCISNFETVKFFFFVVTHKEIRHVN